MPLFLHATSPSSLAVTDDSTPRDAAFADQSVDTASRVVRQPRILIQFHFGPTGVALDPGIPHLAASLGAEVTLLLVVRPPSAHTAEWLATPRSARGDIMPAVDLLERQAHRRLQGLARAFPGLKVETEVLVGDDPDREIARWLRHEQYDLVIQPLRTDRFSLKALIGRLGGARWAARGAALTGCP